MNIVVLRTDMSANQTFRELLRRVHHLMQSAYAHQELPYSMLIRALRSAPAVTRGPIYQVALNMMGGLESDFSLRGLVCKNLPTSGGTYGRHDLTLHAIESETIDFTLEYKRDLFSRARMLQFQEQFSGLISQIVINPDFRLMDPYLPSSNPALGDCTRSMP